MARALVGGVRDDSHQLLRGCKKKNLTLEASLKITAEPSQLIYPSADPVCIISTMVHASHIRTTAYNDCVFIACPRSNTVETMEGDDIVYFREEVHNNKVALGPGRDRGIAHEGSTFAMYNKFKAVWTSNFGRRDAVAVTASVRWRGGPSRSTQ